MRNESAILKEKLVLLNGAGNGGSTEEMSAGGKIEMLRDIALSLLDEIDTLRSNSVPDIERGIDLFDEVRRFETELIRRALKLAHGSQTRAARLLGVNPTTLNYKIKRYKIAPFDSRGYLIGIDSISPVEEEGFDAGVSARA
jgi:transcriptional regulator with GAF, ATPase, and Fis domain